MINVVVRVHEDSRLERVLDVVKGWKDPDLLEDAHTQATRCSYTFAHQIVEQAAVKLIQFGGFDDLSSKKSSKFPKSLESLQCVTTHLM